MACVTEQITELKNRVTAVEAEVQGIQLTPGPKGDKGDPGSPGEGYDSVAAMVVAGTTATDKDDAYLTQAGRQGKYVFSEADLSGAVAADPDQYYYIAPASDTTGSSGAWVRVMTPARDIMLANGLDGESKFNGSRSGVYNRIAGQLHNWNATIARHIRGAGYGRIFCIGDSTVHGVGSQGLNVGLTAAITSNCRINSWPTQLTELLTQLPGVNAVESGITGDGFEGANITNFEPRLTLAAGWTIHPTVVSAGGRPFLDESLTSPPLTWTPGYDTNTLEVLYTTFPGYADFIVTVGGAFLDNALTNGPEGILVKKFTRSSGFNLPWVIQKGAGTAAAPLVINGVMAYNSADKPLLVFNLGMSGSEVADYVSNPGPFGTLAAMRKLADPENIQRKDCLSLISLTINDTVRLTSKANFIARKTAIIDRMKEVGDVVLVSGVPSSLAAANQPRQLEVLEWEKELARTKNLRLINFHERWVANAYNPANDFYTDGLHPNEPGYFDYARAILNEIFYVG